MMSRRPLLIKLTIILTSQYLSLYVSRMLTSIPPFIYLFMYVSIVTFFVIMIHIVIISFPFDTVVVFFSLLT